MIIAATLLAGTILIKSPLVLTQRTTEAQRVRAVVTGIIDADNRKNLNQVMSFYEENAILLPPGEAEVKGKREIRPRYEQLFNNFELDIRTIINEIRITGEWAYVRGRNAGKLIALADRKQKQLSDAYLMILHKNKKGGWRIARLIWNTAPPQENSKR
jgi:uncharacterized protein (TIGR02246 family)